MNAKLIILFNFFNFTDFNQDIVGMSGVRKGLDHKPSFPSPFPTFLLVKGILSECRVVEALYNNL